MKIKSYQYFNTLSIVSPSSWEKCVINPVFEISKLFTKETSFWLYRPRLFVVLFVCLFFCWFLFCFFVLFLAGNVGSLRISRTSKIVINSGDANQILAAIQLKMNLWFIVHIVFTSEQRDCFNFLNKLLSYLYLTLDTLDRKSGFSQNKSLWKPCWNLKLMILSCILSIIRNISSFLNKNWNCLKFRCFYMYKKPCWKFV